MSLVARTTGLSRPTILAGLRELRLPPKARAAAAYRIRRPGGGRRAVTVTDPQLLAALMALTEPTTRGDTESPLRWTCKSTATLAEELTRQHHPVSDRTVAALLKQAGYSLQANRKTREGAAHPDRDAQFAYLVDCVRRRSVLDRPSSSRPVHRLVSDCHVANAASRASRPAGGAFGAPGPHARHVVGTLLRQPADAGWQVPGRHRQIPA